MNLLVWQQQQASNTPPEVCPSFSPFPQPLLCPSIPCYPSRSHPLIRCALRQVPGSFLVRGAVGPPSVALNGEFHPSGELSGGMPVYRRGGEGEEVWMEFWASTKEWLVRGQGDRGSSRAWATLKTDPPRLPYQHHQYIVLVVGPREGREGQWHSLGWC